ncbi:LolA family protein [Rhodophyticola sp. SM2404]
MKKLLLSLALSAVTAFPVLAEPIPLARLSQYLNELQTAEGRFTHINADGSASEGTIYIHRPGRMRFEYDADDLLVIAGGGQVAIFDGRSNQRPEQYPLRRTPLNLILRRNVDLAGSGMVTALEQNGDFTLVTALDPDTPEAGTITLVFSDNPVQLRSWMITDQAGGQTQLELGAFEQGVQIGARLFNIPQEIEERSLD